MEIRTVLWGLLIPFLGTAAGAGCVFFLKKDLKPGVQRALTGFAAGVMVAASIWSLIVPAMEQSAAMGRWAFLPYADGSGYEARFSRCGICTLMGELGLFDLVPAMCNLDYTMSEAGGHDFVRAYTLASGGPYCDCGYKKKERNGK